MVLLGSLLVVGIATGPALAYEGVSVKHAHRHVVKAERDLARAKTALSEARHVERATRYYSAHDYSDFAGRNVEPVPVGRWVWLSRQTGWQWSSLDILIHIIARESSGMPGVLNTQGSGALGLLQEMPDFYLWYNVPYYDRADARQNLRVGLIAWRRDGWRPWGM